jgi:hypothetical protein
VLKRKKHSSFIFFPWGILKGKGGSFMTMKGWALTAGLGAAAGAVAILMMPRNNPTRKLAAQAANKVEDLAWKVSDKFSQEMDF